MTILINIIFSFLTFLRPINNWFRKTSIKILNASKKRALIAETELQNFNILSLSHSTEQQPQIVKIEGRSKTPNPPDFYLSVSLTNLTSLTSYFKNPNSEYINEGMFTNKDLSSTRDVLNISMFRIRRILKLVEVGLQEVKHMLRF